MEMIAKDYYIKQKVREREQGSGETERERACVRGRVLQGEEDSIGYKVDH
jgi:hypothetical protein